MQRRTAADTPFLTDQSIQAPIPSRWPRLANGILAHGLFLTEVALAIIARGTTLETLTPNGSQP